MNLLKEKRMERGLTQEELAKELGVSTNTLVKWENQYSRPSRKSIKMLSDYFDVPARVFIDEFHGTNKASTWDKEEPTEDKEESIEDKEEPTEDKEEPTEDKEEPIEDKKEPIVKELTITRKEYNRAANSSISKLLNIVGDNKSVMLAAAMLKAEIECRLWP